MGLGDIAPRIRSILAWIFGAAGANHTPGIVPDPGATSHANRPMVLKDTALFGFLSGELLGASYVATDESTTSTTYVDLTTLDSVTFTLDVTTTVYVVYLAKETNTNTAVAQYNQIMVDGALIASTIFPYTTTAANAIFMGACFHSVSLAAGSHTIKVQHRVTAGTGDWINRLLLVIAG